MIFRRNAPIIDDEGEIRAYMAKDLDLRGEQFNWTWFSPSSHCDLVAGPKYEELQGKMVPANRGTLRVAYQRGQFMVLSCFIDGDQDGAFAGDMFREPSVPVSATWAGKLSALDILSEHLNHPMMEPQLYYLREMFTHYAENDA